MKYHPFSRVDSYLHLRRFRLVKFNTGGNMHLFFRSFADGNFVCKGANREGCDLRQNDFSNRRKTTSAFHNFNYSRREPNSYGFVWQISTSAADKMLAISYITAHFLFASAKYLFTQNCKSPSGVEIFDGFSQSELKQDADLARRDLAKDAKIARRRAYAFDSLRL